MSGIAVVQVGVYVPRNADGSPDKEKTVPLLIPLGKALETGIVAFDPESEDISYDTQEFVKLMARKYRDYSQAAKKAEREAKKRRSTNAIL